MSNDPLDLICHLIADAPALDQAEQAQALMAVQDTLAVTLAGWAMPVVQKCRSVFHAPALPPIDGGEPGLPETAAFQMGVAGHALDYDDVHLTSVTHPSTVIVPALIALTGSPRDTSRSLLQSYAVGLATNIALGEALCFQHYDAGWHATSTIGAVAGAAAGAHFLGLDDKATRSALALAASQAGGLQRNFGSMAKPVQAGNAAAAAVRSVLLAAAGVTGDQNILGEKGFLDLYGDATARDRMQPVRPRYQLDTLSRKLFSCCYASHRLISAAFEAREQLGDRPLPETAEIDIRVPFGIMTPLRVFDPKTGPEGQFCASYITAVALHSGAVLLTDFVDAAVARPEIRKIMAHIRITEDPAPDPLPVGLDHGSVRLSISTDGQRLATSDVSAFPGSAAAPARQDEMDRKIADCLDRYNHENGRSLTPRAFEAAIRQLIA